MSTERTPPTAEEIAAEAMWRFDGADRDDCGVPVEKYAGEGRAIVAALRAAHLLPPDTPQPGGEELIDVAWQAIRGNAECQRFVGDCFTVPNPQCVCRADAEAAVKAVDGYVLARLGGLGGEASTDAFIAAYAELRTAWEALPELREDGRNVMALGRGLTRCKEAQQRLDAAWAALAASQPKDA